MAVLDKVWEVWVLSEVQCSSIECFVEKFCLILAVWEVRRLELQDWLQIDDHCRTGSLMSLLWASVRNIVLICCLWLLVRKWGKFSPFKNVGHWFMRSRNVCQLSSFGTPNKTKISPRSISINGSRHSLAECSNHISVS